MINEPLRTYEENVAMLEDAWKQLVAYLVSQDNNFDYECLNNGLKARYIERGLQCVDIRLE